MLCPNCGEPIVMRRTVSVETNGVKDLINFIDLPLEEMTQDQLKDLKDYFKLYKKYYKKGDEDCDAKIAEIDAELEE